MRLLWPKTILQIACGWPPLAMLLKQPPPTTKQRPHNQTMPAHGHAKQIEAPAHSMWVAPTSHAIKTASQPQPPPLPQAHQNNGANGARNPPVTTPNFEIQGRAFWHCVYHLARKCHCSPEIRPFARWINFGQGMVRPLSPPPNYPAPSNTINSPLPHFGPLS